MQPGNADARAVAAFDICSGGQHSGHMSNPLLPSILDVMWGSAALLIVTLALIALVQIYKRRGDMGTESTVVFALVVLVVPVFGAVFWFVVNALSLRRQRARFL